jgi:hypothetical protein
LQKSWSKPPAVAALTERGAHEEVQNELRVKVDRFAAEFPGAIIQKLRYRPALQ